VAIFKHRFANSVRLRVSQYNWFIQAGFFYKTLIVSQKSFVPHLPLGRWDKTFLDSYTTTKTEAAPYDF
jgi:hypothetical protein